MDNSQIPEGGFNLNEWEQIQSPSSNTLPTNPTREWDMVAIRDNYLQDSLSFFPPSPSQHEVLPIRSEMEKPNSQSSASASALSSSSSSYSLSNDLVTDRSSSSALRPRFKILGFGMVRIVANVRHFALHIRGFCSFASVTVFVAALVLSLMYTKVRMWRRRIQDENNRLILSIKEKDQKINQLLLQIAQMNELLSTRRKVPVLRSG